MTRLAQTADLTDVQQEILSTVRSFVDKEIIPTAQALEHADQYPTAIVEGLKEMGVFGLMIPEEFGGLGESLLTYALVVEEIARGWMSVSGVINTHFIVAYMVMQHGTPEQRQRLLPRMATGEVRGAFSMSEPGLGSDVAGIRTKASRQGDGNYVIDGQKMWLTNGWAPPGADLRRLRRLRRRRPRRRARPGLQPDDGRRRGRPGQRGRPRLRH